MNAAKDVIRKHRLSVHDYHRMGDAGILAMDARVELIEGEIVDMTPIGSKHASIVTRMTEMFYRKMQTRAIVSVQSPITLAGNSEPEPDIILLRPRKDYYSDAHPHADDVLLIVEVADTTLRYDLEIKVPLYARCGIPEVWIVDIRSMQINMFSSPDDGVYQCEDLPAELQSVRPRELPDMVIDLSRLF